MALSDETRRKMSEAHKGKTLSPERRAAFIATHAGKPLSPEIRAKISETVKARWENDDEYRRRIKDANIGKKHAPETLEKMRETHRGERHSNWGKHLSEETRRKISEANKGRKWPVEMRVRRSGPNSHAWKGGVSFEPYCVKFNNEFKERVREFFGRVCVECGSPENGVRLSIHHVNARKDACCAEDVIPLFVPLCPSCHGKAHHNQEYWEARFTTFINEQYGGRCYLPKETEMEGTPSLGVV